MIEVSLVPFIGLSWRNYTVVMKLRQNCNFAFLGISAHQGPNTLLWGALLGKQCICSYKCSKRTFSVAAESPFLLVGTASQTLWTAPCRGWLRIRKPNAVVLMQRRNKNISCATFTLVMYQLCENDFFYLEFAAIHQPHPTHGVTGFQFLGCPSFFCHVWHHTVHQIMSCILNPQQIGV